MSHTDRQGGPGSSHQNRQDPDKSAPTGHKHAQPPQGPQPGEPTNPDRSRVSGGGGERDRHHTHDSRKRS
ncbi:hypothetical protein [Pseudoroseomonas cervicalis]|uniref:hypothetical protein n=1 Tax=Teichococcus cervicalis TaxID=204525 RepID=UPI0022F1C3F9|nr:hypothetical protein [Pseudoroseomonas cervicalis]WBV43364.1 hypothetical protein PFY06_01965 [Pseudoroseomonas cervicalis]